MQLCDSLSLSLASNVFFTRIALTNAYKQSLWNFENRFTGWKDIPLTEKGIKEAEDAGNLMQKHNFSIDLVFTSILERAIETAKIAIKQMHLDHLWKKNESTSGEKVYTINIEDFTILF